MYSPDTAQRSLAHWSEAGRTGMQAFYALATEDYRQLALARDWTADLREQAVDQQVRLLDVACGSGRFPAALLAHWGTPEKSASSSMSMHPRCHRITALLSRRVDVHP
jgi:hypothetical protein